MPFTSLRKIYSPNKMPPDPDLLPRRWKKIQILPAARSSSHVTSATPFPGQNGRILAGILSFPGQKGRIPSGWPGSGPSPARTAGSRPSGRVGFGRAWVSGIRSGRPVRGGRERVPERGKRGERDRDFFF
jgi:hypothetical protein